MREIDKKWVNDCEKVICQICLKEYKSITNTHLRTHNITQKDYRKIYPFEQQHSMATLKKIQLNGLKNKHIFNKNRVIPTKKIIEKASNKAKERVSEYIKLHGGFYNRTLESNIKQSKRMKKLVKEGKWLNPVYMDGVKEKISLYAKKRWEYVKLGKDGKIIGFEKQTDD